MKLFAILAAIFYNRYASLYTCSRILQRTRSILRRSIIGSVRPTASVAQQPQFNHRILPKYHSQDKKMLIGTCRNNGNTQEGRRKDEQMNRPDDCRTKTDNMLVQWHNHRSRHKTPDQSENVGNMLKMHQMMFSW